MHDPFVVHLDIQIFVHRASSFTPCWGISILSSVFKVWLHWASGLGSDEIGLDFCGHVG